MDVWEPNASVGLRSNPRIKHPSDRLKSLYRTDLDSVGREGERLYSHLFDQTEKDPKFGKNRAFWIVMSEGCPSIPSDEHMP